MNGLIPLDFTEINAYMQSTNTELLPFEVLLIRKLSNAYVSQSYDKDINAIPPYATVKKIGMSSDAVKNAFAGICSISE